MPRKSTKTVSKKPAYSSKAVRVAAPRRAPRYSSSVGKTIGSAVGGMLGGSAAAAFAPETDGLSLALAPMAKKFGSMAGGYIGDQIGSWISGKGMYRIQSNVLLNPGSIVPEFRGSDKRGTRIRHREYIADVVASATTGAGGSTLFKISQTLTVNAGNAFTFPWLSQISNNFEQYQFQGLIFEYKTTSGSQSASSALGSVIMATQYNVLSPLFTNKQQMENYEFANSSVPKRSFIHPIECDPKQTQCGGIFNVQTSVNSGTGADQRLYDMGTFSIASVGIPTASIPIGELWVSYDVLLMKPRLNTLGAGYFDHWVGVGTGFAGGSQYFGTDIALTLNSDKFTSIPTGTTITFNTGFFGNVLLLMYIQSTGNATTCVNPTIVGSNGAANFTGIISGGSAGLAPLYQVTTSTPMIIDQFFKVQPLGDGTVPTLTFSAGTFQTGVTHVDIFFIQLPTNAS